MRRRVEPLDVVHCDEERLRASEEAERPDEGRRERVRLRRLRSRLLQEQRDREGAPLRRRKLGQHLLGGIADEVAKRGKGDLSVRPGRAGREHTQPARPRELDPFRPHLGLADPRRAEEEEAARTMLEPSQHFMDRIELGVSSDGRARSAERAHSELT